MSASMRRNACPSLAAPMPTGDGLLARITYDTLILAPQFICEQTHIDEMFDKTRAAIKRSMNRPQLRAVG